MVGGTLSLVRCSEKLVLRVDPAHARLEGPDPRHQFVVPLIADGVGVLLEPLSVESGLRPLEAGLVDLELLEGVLVVGVLVVEVLGVPLVGVDPGLSNLERARAGRRLGNDVILEVAVGV